MWVGLLLPLLLLISTTSAQRDPNAGGRDLAPAAQQSRRLAEAAFAEADVDDDDDNEEGTEDKDGDGTDDDETDTAHAAGRLIQPPMGQSKTARRRRRVTTAKELAVLRNSNPALYDSLSDWVKGAPALNLTDAASAHAFMTQFVTLQGRSVTWRTTKLEGLLPYMRLLLPSATVTCGQACKPKMMEHVINPVSAIVAKHQGKFGVWFFVEAHKLILNVKQHVRYTVHGCGVTEPTPNLQGRTWAAFPPGEFEVLRNHRWYEVTRRTQPISSSFAKFWCPLPEVLSASGTAIPVHNPTELTLRLVWDVSTGGWKRVPHTPELAMSTAIAQELKPWLKIQLDECPDVCPLSTFEPLVLPRTTNMGRLGIVVGLMHHQTPLLGKFMEYYQQQFGASHFVFYTNESWVPAQVQHIPAPPGVTTSVYHWPSPLQTYKFGKSLALADFTDRARFAFDWVLSIDVDEFIIFKPDQGEPAHFLDWLDAKVSKDPSIACYTLLRHNVQRNCSDPATIRATPETVTLEQMRGNKDRFYVSPKAVYALQRTQQLQIHRCWPLGKNKMMTFPEHQGWIAHLSRNEPDSDQCKHGPDWTSFNKESRISWWEHFGEGGKVARWFNAMQDLQAGSAGIAVL